MFTKRGTYGILFVLLFFIKSSALHAYTHDNHHADKASHCQTCEIQQLQAPLLVVAELDCIANNELVIISASLIIITEAAALHQQPPANQGQQ